MRKVLILALLLASAPAAADGCLAPCAPPSPALVRDCPYPCYDDTGPTFYGDPRWRQPPPRAWDRQERIPRGTLHGAITPLGDVAYPLKPGHIQAPPEMRKAFPYGVPPTYLYQAPHQ